MRARELLLLSHDQRPMFLAEGGTNTWDLLTTLLERTNMEPSCPVGAVFGERQRGAKLQTIGCVHENKAKTPLDPCKTDATEMKPVSFRLHAG